MPKLRITLALLTFLLAGALPASDLLSPEKTQKLLDRGKFEQAAEALDQVVEAGEPIGSTWFQLAYARHALGHYELAIKAGEQAVLHPSYQATGLYNLACSFALSGELEHAAKSLGEAVECGFLDFDLMETDADLASVRAANRLPVAPPKLEYKLKKARNRLEVPYHVLLPKNFDRERDYPFVIAFPPGLGTRSADWMIHELFPGGMGERELVMVVVAAPDSEKGWLNHPTHHALEDLFKELKKTFSVKGDRFHFFSYGSGYRPAATYSEMSSKFVASVTAVAGAPFGDWSDKDIRGVGKRPLTLFLGSEDIVYREGIERVNSILRDRENFKLHRIEGDDHLLKSLRGRRLVELLEEACRRTED